MVPQSRGGTGKLIAVSPSVCGVHIDMDRGITQTAQLPHPPPKGAHDHQQRHPLVNPHFPLDFSTFHHYSDLSFSPSGLPPVVKGWVMIALR